MSEVSQEFFLLDANHRDPVRIKHEREKARSLRNTHWWREKLSVGLCHYCGEKFEASRLTMDHVIPLARGGTSARGNIVAACSACNRSKNLSTPVDELFKKIASEREV